MSDMPPATLEALKESIVHWERVLSGEDLELGYMKCALCRKFRMLADTCAGCPVRESTGQPYCEGSPYVDVTDAVAESTDGSEEENLMPTIIKDPKFREAAQKELDFLRSLLPKPESNELPVSTQPPV